MKTHSPKEAGNPTVEEPRGGTGVPEEEEGVHQVPRKQSRCVGESKQGLDRGAEVLEGTVHRRKDDVSSYNKIFNGEQKQK